MAINSLRHLKIDVSKDESGIKNNDMSFNQTFERPFPLREKCPNAGFFWSVFSCIRTEYGDLLRKSPYSVRIQENTDQKNLRIWTLHAVFRLVNHRFKLMDYL